MYDRFEDDVRTIVELEEEVRLSNLRGTKIEDRMRELHYRYQSLLRLWPIVPGRGTQKEGGLNVDDKRIE
jgi:hypothetical protein